MIVSCLALLARVVVLAPLTYLYVLALASMRSRRSATRREPRSRFAIAIPAHDEQVVIDATVRRLLQLDYPNDLFDVYVVADHCSDATAAAAQAAGARVLERTAEPRGSKGLALQWLFQQLLPDLECDAVVIFDADTYVERDFLRVMDARLAEGHRVVQGQHRIRNPEDGLVPALIWSTFIVDNRLQNLGRTALGCSAKNMGDSVCFRIDLLREFGWGEGLADDYTFRQQLLLQGTRIFYEPDAVGYGEAPLTLKSATLQRARWIRGTRAASQRYAPTLIAQALRRRDIALIEAAVQSTFPSYSTLTMLAAGAWLASCIRSGPTNWWIAPLSAIVAYPALGLVLERAPRQAYLAMLAGPLFVAWRSWLTLQTRLGATGATWVRTPRKLQQQAVAP